MRQRILLPTLLLCLAVAVSSMWASRAGAAKDGPLIARANKDECTWWVDGVVVAKEAKSIQVQVTPEPHQLVVQAKGYKKRVLSVVPPYGATFAQNVTFTMGDQVVALE